MIFETHNKQFSLVSATVCCGLAMCLTEPGSCGVDIHGPAPLASQVKALCLECMRGFEHTVTFDCSFRIILATRVYTGKASCHIHSRPCYSHATPRYNHATPCYTTLQPRYTMLHHATTIQHKIQVVKHMHVRNWYYCTKVVSTTTQCASVDVQSQQPPTVPC